MFFLLPVSSRYFLYPYLPNFMFFTLFLSKTNNKQKTRNKTSTHINSQKSKQNKDQ